MDSTQAQKSSFLTIKPEAQQLLPDSRNIIRLTQKEVKTKRRHWNMCCDTGAQSVQSTPVRTGPYLVEQPHEEHGQAGVEHVVEGDEPVFVRGLWGDDRVCVSPTKKHCHASQHPCTCPQSKDIPRERTPASPISYARSRHEFIFIEWAEESKGFSQSSPSSNKRGKESGLFENCWKTSVFILFY